MTPMQMQAFLDEQKIHFKALIVLEQLANSRTTPLLTDTLVRDLTKNKLVSPATTYKYLARLKKRRWVQEVQLKKQQDKRCTYLAPTPKGICILKDLGWMWGSGT